MIWKAHINIEHQKGKPATEQRKICKNDILKFWQAQECAFAAERQVSSMD